MSIDLQKIQEIFDSEEGRLAMNQFHDNFIKKQKTRERHIERFKKDFKFKSFTEKVIQKYNSNEYAERWYKRGIEPPTTLLWFLYHFVQQYGRTCKKSEWKKYGNMFTTDLLYYKKYYFNRMDGQGSVIQVIKK